MPFYEYECSNCKFYVEVLQKISDEPLRKCPSCKKQALKKLVSAPVFRLKGAGWYETDFKSDAEDKRNLADRDQPADKAEESKAAAPAEASADKQVESKPEAKSGGDKKVAAKAAPKGKKPAPAKVAARPSKPSRPAAKKAPPAKKKAKRR